MVGWTIDSTFGADDDGEEEGEEDDEEDGLSPDVGVVSLSLMLK